ncbi:MAG: class I SAM-dependent methyltransferase [Oscillospiraceae bacterium]|jgi:ubiquinone/menaquinone biosynthesis C-methylase UbiE|nr:class I SAM-dependent methyltransferase [Oscillospiraceae bacterium]
MNQPQALTPTERFTGKAAAYDRSRPDYPAGALECIRQQCGLAPGAAVADIGAGTGKLTRMLLAQGYNVVAVEPNAAMRTAATEQLGDSPALRLVAAAAEATTLADHSVDAITVAQAFHWFDHAACQTEFARILKPGGKAALLWNSRDKDQPLPRKHGELMEKYRVREAVNIANPHALYATFFQSYEIFRFPYAQQLDEAALLALSFSRSYSPAPNEPGYAELERAVRQLFAKHQRGGTVEYAYRTAVVVGAVAR